MGEPASDAGAERASKNCLVAEHRDAIAMTIDILVGHLGSGRAG